MGATIFVYEAAQIWWVEQPVSAHETVHGNLAASAMFLVFAAVMGLRFARLGAYPRERGIKILNTYNSCFIPWTEIGGFSLRNRLWFGRSSQVGYVDKVDGSSVRISGIQATSRGQMAAQGLIADLNALLAEHRDQPS